MRKGLEAPIVLLMVRVGGVVHVAAEFELDRRNPRWGLSEAAFRCRSALPEPESELLRKT